jgi:hypothetical protein
MKNIDKNNKIVIYQSPGGSLQLRGDFKNDTIWATQSDIVTLFNIDQPVVSRHINNIFKSGEIDLKSNMQKMHIANSVKAINFRKWATKTLHSYIVDGYAINKSRIAQYYADLRRQIFIREHRREGGSSFVFHD